MPKINGNEVRPGMILEHNDGLWVAVKCDRVKPGKGGAFAQVELRNLRTGSKLNERFRSADKVERVSLEQRDHQYLYEEDDLLHFMDANTYDQVFIQSELVGEKAQFLVPGLEVIVSFYDDEVLDVELPQKVVCRIVETEPVITGQTAANSFKPALLENGLRVMVPPFINADTDVYVNTETKEYVERA
ncbi:MAG: elongation factor P [Rhodobacteraceae bacterium]|nr:elongation factor P [Paracoccaceae bacterium]